MKELGIQAKYGRKRCRNIYTCKDKEKYIHENLFAQLTAQERENLEIWSMDFTEEKIQGKKIYGNTAQMPQSALYNRFRIKTVDNL